MRSIKTVLASTVVFLLTVVPALAAGGQARLQRGRRGQDWSITCCCWRARCR